MAVWVFVWFGMWLLLTLKLLVYGEQVEIQYLCHLREHQVHLHQKAAQIVQVLLEVLLYQVQAQVHDQAQKVAQAHQEVLLYQVQALQVKTYLAKPFKKGWHLIQVQLTLS